MCGNFEFLHVYLELCMLIWIAIFEKSEKMIMLVMSFRISQTYYNRLKNFLEFMFVQGVSI